MFLSFVFRRPAGTGSNERMLSLAYRYNDGLLRTLQFVTSISRLAVIKG